MIKTCLFLDTIHVYSAFNSSNHSGCITVSGISIVYPMQLHPCIILTHCKINYYSLLNCNPTLDPFVLIPCYFSEMCMSIVNKPLFLFFYRVLLLMILYKFSSNEINYQSVVPQGKLRKVINSQTMDVLHVLFHRHGLNHIHTVWNTIS